MNRTPLFLACLLASTSAWAGDVDLSRVCPADGTPPDSVEPARVVYAVLDSLGSPASRGVFDANQDGTETLRERLDAILDRGYCDGAGKELCADGDSRAMDDARTLLEVVLGEDIAIEQVATTTDADRAEWPRLADEEFGRLAAILDERKRFFRLSCPTQTADAAPQRKRASVTDRFRLTGDIDSLTLRRDTANDLRAVTQAEVSYTANRLDDSETFQVTAYAGYDFARTENRQFIPFVGFEREQTRQSGPDDDGTSRVSAGFVYGAEFESYDSLFVTPLYVVDRIHDSRIASLRASWTPGFLYRIDALPMGNARPLGPLVARMDLQLRAQAGRVIDAGDSAELADTDDYFRIGPAFALELWPTSGNAFLSRLSADAAYRRFFRVSGPADVEWWGAGINYSVQSNDHVTIRYSYEHGEDEETLEKSKQWKLVLGVRF